MNLEGQDAVSIAADVRQGKTTATRILEQTLDRIRAVNPRVNAFTEITELRARSEAERIDRVVAAGENAGALAGVPFAVKNLFDIAGVTTLAGSIIRKTRPPAIEDATVIRRLCAAGAVLVGALNMDEFAYGFTTENTHYGPTRNPHDLTRTAGGSSGGSGAAVAAGLVPFALGTDTGGSIRVPASVCGLFGLRPTFGRLSRSGSVLFVPSLDHVGPLARSVRDLALAYDVMQGPDSSDPVCTSSPPAPTYGRLEEGIGNLRFGVAGGHFRRYATEEALQAVDRVARHLGAYTEIELPRPDLARAAAYIIGAAEGASLHFDDLRERLDDFDPNTRGRFLAGALLPASWYVKAQRFRRWLNDEIDKLFSHVDVILAPTTPCSATKLGQQTLELGGETLMSRPALGLLTQPFSAAGVAIVSVPVRGSGDLPMGVQVITAPHNEELALRVAFQLERGGVAAAQIRHLH